jgi:hypothetical protein
VGPAQFSLIKTNDFARPEIEADNFKYGFALAGVRLLRKPLMLRHQFSSAPCKIEYADVPPCGVVWACQIFVKFDFLMIRRAPRHFPTKNPGQALRRSESTSGLGGGISQQSDAQGKQADPQDDRTYICEIDELVRTGRIRAEDGQKERRRKENR